MTTGLIVVICVAGILAFIGLVILLHGLVARMLQTRWPDDDP